MRSCDSTRGHLRRLATFFGALFWISGGMLFARDAEVRTTLEVKGDVWVGQGMTLVVELLSPGFFAGSPTFYLPRVPEVLILQPDKRPVLASTNINGASYTIQRHELRIFGQRAGHMAIPSFQVRFSTREGALAPVEHLLRTDAVSVEVKLPPGAEGLATLISARELRATEIWQPDTVTAKAGDSFTRTITFSAPDVPAMAFPPFAATDIAGLGVYPNTPILLDRSERGTMRGERKDTITYVCKRPGQFVVPAARFTWWDLDHHQLRKVDFPGRTFEVAANPALPGRAAASGSMEGRNLRTQIRALGVVAGLSALAGIGFWISRRRPDWWRSISFWSPVHLAPLNPSTSTDLRPRADGDPKPIALKAILRI
jgi:hypothetical protein